MIRTVYFVVLVVLLFNSMTVRADFVDMATISINNKFIRKVTNNSPQTYLLHLSKDQAGDTLRITLWTDHGGERNAYITLTDIETRETIEFPADHYHILNSTFLEHNFLISAKFVYTYPREFEITWDIFQTTSSPQIEQLYTSLNQFVDFMTFTRYRSAIWYKTFILDSIQTNFVWIAQSHAPNQRISSDTVLQSGSRFYQFLLLNDSEKEYFENFDANNYFKMYNLHSSIHGTLKIDQQHLDHYSFEMRNRDYRLRFEFIYRDNRYLLDGIFYETY